MSSVVARKCNQRILTYFVRGRITVLLTSCLNELNWTREMEYIEGALFIEIYWSLVSLAHFMTFSTFLIF